MEAEQSRLPESLQTFLTEYDESDQRQIEKKVSVILGIADDILKGQMETPRITTSFNGEEYQLWLKKVDKDGETKISFEVTPTKPTGSGGDRLFEIDGHYLYDSEGDDVDDLEEADGYIEAIQHLKIEIQALSGLVN